MPENISLDLFNLLVFTMPGFFFVRAFNIRVKSDFEYFMFSMFWGILIIVLFYKILPLEKFSPLLESPYAGAIVFSIIGYSLGFIIKLIKNFTRYGIGGVL